MLTITNRASNIKKIFTLNKKVQFDYNIINTWEAGISLMPSEVQAIAAGHISIKSAYASIEAGEVFMINMHISKSVYSHIQHDPIRKKKLLLHKKEINKMIKGQDKFHTLVPTQVHINSKNKIKIIIALCEGKNRIDKRKTIMNREMSRLSAIIRKKVMH